MERTLGIIPARGGSKGLPGKNIMSIAGEPLIYWTIKTAKDSRLLSNFVISTDEPAIKEISECAGGNVPFLRPKELAGDKTSSTDVVLHCIEYFEEQNTHFDNIVLLEPSSPLRKSDDIDNALKMFYNNYSNVDGIISVGKIHLENPSVVKYIDNNLIFPISKGFTNKITRRQDYPEFYFPYGVLYIIKTDILKEKRSFYTDRIMPFVIERWQNYELDDIYDFYAIETIMKNKIKEGVL
jgi:CMP-N,N'-diacetyllegionaminic acid synthase